ncbi:MAG: radical SAM protein [Deltaproteobacteria bacterium]|nr:radical SAM protein [Deltaproteobacteria bacterium]
MAYEQPPLIRRCIENLDVERRFPIMLILDLTNVCNFECPHCPQPIMASQPDYRASFMSFDDYKKIVDEAAEEDVKFIRFTGDGEPMLNRRLLDMVAYAKEKTSISLVLTTNGSMLTPERSERLLDLGIDVIDVSLDAFTKEKYAIVRKGGKYHEVIGNLHHLLALREKKKSKTRVMVNMIDQKIVADEVDDFKKYWEPLVDFVLVRNLHTATKRVNQAEVGQKMEREQPDRHACAHLWKRLTIDPALNVKFCAHDWFDETVLSKLGPGGIRSIWFSERLKEIRKAHWAAAPWDYGYEKIIEKIGVIKLPF